MSSAGIGSTFRVARCQIARGRQLRRDLAMVDRVRRYAAIAPDSPPQAPDWLEKQCLAWSASRRGKKKRR
jgi:hypothetical protein